MTMEKSHAFLVIGLWLVASLMAAASHGAADLGHLATARAVITPQMLMPLYLEPTVDPAFRTSFTRVTDPGGEMIAGMPCRRQGAGTGMANQDGAGRQSKGRTRCPVGYSFAAPHDCRDHQTRSGAIEGSPDRSLILHPSLLFWIV
jgi:hypothetical protein